jgi:hypothetical protein
MKSDRNDDVVCSIDQGIPAFRAITEIANPRKTSKKPAIHAALEAA